MLRGHRGGLPERSRMRTRPGSETAAAGALPRTPHVSLRKQDRYLGARVSGRPEARVARRFDVSEVRCARRGARVPHFCVIPRKWRRAGRNSPRTYYGISVPKRDYRCRKALENSIRVSSPPEYYRPLEPKAFLARDVSSGGEYRSAMFSQRIILVPTLKAARTSPS